MAEDFHGYKVNSLDNGFMRLDYLAGAGPRIVRLSRSGRDVNLFVDVHDIAVPTPYGEYFFQGGHRLWHAPEDMPGSYVPDNSGLTVAEVPDGVRLSAPAEAPTGIAKTVEIRLALDRAVATLHHELRNDGQHPVELAPWSLTQLCLGGLAVLPLPAGPEDAAGLLPNRQLTFWPYTSFRDPRLSLEDEAVLVRAQAQLPPVKVGYRCPPGWLGYWNAGTFFVKRFRFDPDARYPDLGCNAEAFCNHRFIELESLGPLAVLAPGGSVFHTETWELFPTWDQPFVPEAIRALLHQADRPAKKSGGKK
jgi:hypothetical protein